MVALGVKVGLVSGADRVTLFVLLLQSCTPPALNMTLLASIAGKGEGAVSELLCVSYCLSLFTITAWVSVLLLLLRADAFGS